MRQQKPRSIAEFMRAARMKNCAMCKVPKPVRMEVTSARRRGIGVSIILDWLKSEHGFVVSREQLRAHFGGMHDGRAGMLSRTG